MPGDFVGGIADDWPYRKNIVERRQLKASLAENSKAEIFCVSVDSGEHPEQELSFKQTLKIVVAVDRRSQDSRDLKYPHM